MIIVGYCSNNHCKTKEHIREVLMYNLGVTHLQLKSGWHREVTYIDGGRH